jgi:SAM-dependent methyltransferase
MKFFKYKNKTYPDYIRRGNAVENIETFAKKFCKGKGLDIGGTEKWKLPGSIAINEIFTDGLDAHNLPEGQFDYIFSSHCLEHIENYSSTLKYWKSKIKKGGVLFLYLPHPDMEYWLPQNCEKHIHKFEPATIEKLLTDLGFRNVIVTGRDLYWSFCAVGVK